jgi:hypothetical protein
MFTKEEFCHSITLNSNSIRKGSFILYLNKACQLVSQTAGFVLFQVIDRVMNYC